VATRLRAAYPDADVTISTHVASGDKQLDAPLATLAAASPGLFTKELELGLLAGQFTLAVHSLKDMPTMLPPGLVLSGITEREDPRDVLLVHPRHAGCGGLAGLPEGAVVGTSALRREAFVRKQHKGLVVTDIRGNLNTRYAKLVAGDKYDAIILAAAGVKRMGWEDRIECVLTPEEHPYGVSQGALGIETRAGDHVAAAMARAITDEVSNLRCRLERAVLRSLQGGCQIPLGVHTWVEEASGGGEGDGSQGRTIHIKATVVSRDGKSHVEAAASGACGSEGEVQTLGQSVAQQLVRGGAAAVLGVPSLAEAPREITYGSA
jgi:hydroxymethylbilane synthase